MLLMREENRWEHKSLETESNLTLTFVTTPFVIVDLSDLTDEVVTGFTFTISWLEKMIYLKTMTCCRTDVLQ